MIYDGNAGIHRSIDYLPARQGEFMRMPKSMENAMVESPGSTSPLNASYNPEQAGSTGGMIGRLIGGKTQPERIQNPIRNTDATVPRSPKALAQGTPAPRQTVQQIPPTRPLGKPAMPQAPATVQVRKPRVGI